MVQDLLIIYHKNLAPQRIQELKLLYEDELQRALEEDGSSSVLL